MTSTSVSGSSPAMRRTVGPSSAVMSPTSARSGQLTPIDIRASRMFSHSKRACIPARSMPRSRPPAPVKNDRATGPSTASVAVWSAGAGARFCSRIQASITSRSNTRRAPHCTDGRPPSFSLRDMDAVDMPSRVATSAAVRRESVIAPHHTDVVCILQLTLRAA